MPRLLGAVLLALAAAAAARAGETGSISGVARDATGGVLPGAIVRISGPVLPGGREATTTSTGAYLFPNLLPGPYKIDITFPGLVSHGARVHVAVDVDRQVDLVLGAGFASELIVYTEPPPVDLKSTEVNFNFTASGIEPLPLERSYRGLFQLIPGVPENRSTVGPSGGGSRQDNTYLMDGVNITNPGFGYLSTEVNQLDIAELNVKRGAITAEFGRAAGFVANAVSRSGTNEVAGQARIELLPQALIGGFDQNAFRDPLLTTVVNPAVGVGGPFVKNKLFWYGSGRYIRETKGDRTNRLGAALPDEERTGYELHGKVTATPSPRHLVSLSLRERPTDVKNGSLNAATAPSRSSTSDNGSRIAAGSWSFFATDRTTLEVKVVHLKEKNEATPDLDLGYLPRPFDARNPARMGQYTDPAQGNLVTGAFQYDERLNYSRKEIKATLSRFFDLGRTAHQVKIGGGYEHGDEELFRRANGWGEIVVLGTGATATLRTRYLVEQPPQIGLGRTFSAFVQDTMTLSSRLTINAGVLVNRDEFAQDLDGSGGCPATYQPAGPGVYESDGDRCTFLRFGFGDQIQPRLGVNFGLRPGKNDKVYANYGRYYNLDQKSSGRSLAPRRIFVTQTVFDLTGAVVSSAPLASTTGKLIAADLEPTYHDEWVAGYATPIGSQWSADLFFIYRDTERIIEDMPSRLPATGPYVAANMPCATFDACRGVEAERRYKAVTLEVSRRQADRWSLNASYTWSRLDGNFDLDYAAVGVFNTSSLIQDGPGTNVQEPNRFGPLREDRPHLFKLFASYQPVDRLTLGGYFRIQSGAPWNARGRDTQGNTFNFLEPAGARRNPTWTNLDLLAAYRLQLGSRVGLTLEGRILNVFDAQTALTTESQQFLDLNPIAAPPFIGPYTAPNPLFGTPSAFAPPRRMVVTALLSF